MSAERKQEWEGASMTITGPGRSFVLEGPEK